MLFFFNYYFGRKIELEQNSQANAFFDLISGHPFSSSSYTSGNYKVITIKSIKMDNFDTSSVDCIDFIPANIEQACILELGDILISLTGDTGRIAIVDEINCLLNQRVGKIICTNTFKAYTYALLHNDFTQRFIAQNSVGTSQKNISPIVISDMKTYKPNDDELKNFNSVALPLFDKYVKELQRIKHLIELKNQILPMLMNGQLQVIN